MALIPLQGCFNFKDLGGLEGFGGKLTKSGRIFRADCLSKLTDDDIESLKKMGISLIIDLRSPIEVELNQYNFYEQANITYKNIPLSSDLDPQNMEEAMPGGLIGLYKNVVDIFSPALLEIFTLLADYSQPSKGNIIFHCTAGKDRTGIVAALLLLLKGVAEKDIIADYSESYKNMKPYFDLLLEPVRKIGLKYPEDTLMSDPELMKEFLAYFKSKYNNVEKYLKNLGLDGQKIEALKNIF